MGFRTLLAQMVSILRVKLWKVVIREETCCFSFISGTFYQNVPFLCLRHIFLT